MYCDTGSGRSKKDAKKEAAAIALKSLGYEVSAGKNPYYMAGSTCGQDEANPALCLATHVIKIELSFCSGLSVTHMALFTLNPYDKSFI